MPGNRFAGSLREHGITTLREVGAEKNAGSIALREQSAAVQSSVSSFSTSRAVVLLSGSLTPL